MTGEVPGQDDALLESELRTQVEALQAVVNKLQEDITTTTENLEMQAATAEVQRLRAERASAAIQEEQRLMITAGNRHAAVIVRWWLSGVILAWLLAVTLTLNASPILGFTVFMPTVAIFLAFGFASSSVDMKMAMYEIKKSPRGVVATGQPVSDRETEGFFRDLLGQRQMTAEEAAAAADEERRRRTGSSGVLATTARAAGMVYGTARAVGGVAWWVLSWGLGSGKRDKGD